MAFAARTLQDFEQNYVPDQDLILADLHNCTETSHRCSIQSA